MEVLSLNLKIVEADLNALAAKLLPPDTPIEDVAFLIRPEGICVKGVYPLLVNVAFESWWALDVEEGKVTANMTKLKAFGMPAMVFKSAVLKVLEELSAREVWFEVKGEKVHVDIETSLGRYACPSRLYLRRIACADGIVIIEAGKSA
jgi:hypothetical protein